VQLEDERPPGGARDALEDERLAVVALSVSRVSDVQTSTKSRCGKSFLRYFLQSSKLGMPVTTRRFASAPASTKSSL